VPHYWPIPRSLPIDKDRLLRNGDGAARIPIPSVHTFYKHNRVIILVMHKAVLLSALSRLFLICVAAVAVSGAALRDQTGHLSTSASQSQSPAPGKIALKVVCQSRPQFTYAVYVPSAYAESKSWPIIYCFDPGGQGQIPVERMKAGAEKFGYIVAGSNDSHNGPGVDLESIVTSLAADTRARFNIDPKQVYTAGFSGGARVATGIALASDKVAGVIACSGGFPAGRAAPRTLPFAFFGTAGLEDFNYPEMYGLADSFDAAGAANRFEVFDGGHAWAPEALCTEAIEWMEIQAMKAGRRDRDANQIAAFQQALEARAKADQAAKPYEAYIAYKSLAADLAGLVDVKSFQASAGALKSTKEVRRALKEQMDLIEKQRRRTRELSALLAQMSTRSSTESSDQPSRPSPSGAPSGPVGPATSTGAAGSDDQTDPKVELKHIVASLRKDFDATPGSAQRILARRVLLGFYVGLVESADELLYARSFDRAVQTLTIATEIRPDGQGVFVELARAYVGRKDKARAIGCLRKAIANGFSDPAAIEMQSDFAPLKDDPDFKDLVDGLKARH